MARITQKAIAEHLGLSQMTVSYALGDAAVIGEATKRRVQEAADRLGYRPNGSARAMRSGRFGCVAVIESIEKNRSSHFGGALLDGIHDGLLKSDTHLILVKLPDRDLTDEAFIPKILRQYMVDGLLVNYFAQVPERLVELIAQHQVPAIWINSCRKTDCIYPDDREAAVRATQHLIGLGHRRIGYLDYTNARPPAGEMREPAHYSIRERYAGYADAMETAGLQPHDFFGGRQLTDAQCLNGARSWLADTHRPTAALCYGKRIATQLVHAATEAGLAVPGDLSVVMFADSPSTDLGLTVTSMRQVWYRIGHAAAEMLMKKIGSGNKPMPARALPFELHAGQTCGPTREAIE